MSRKSRRRESAEPPPRRGGTSIAVEAGPAGVPFEVVVGCAALLAAPSVVAFVNGEMGFDATVLRFLVALGVAWVLTTLVLAVYRIIQGPRTDVTVGSGTASAPGRSAGLPPTGPTPGVPPRGAPGQPEGPASGG